MDVYVWPLIEVMQHGSGKLLVRQASQREDGGEERSVQSREKNK